MWQEINSRKKWREREGFFGGKKSRDIFGGKQTAGKNGTNGKFCGREYGITPLHAAVCCIKK